MITKILLIKVSVAALVMVSVPNFHDCLVWMFKTIYIKLPMFIDFHSYLNPF